MNRRLRVAVLDLVTKAPDPGLYGRVMNANYAGIMPQIVALWCEQEGHDVSYICYTGVEDLRTELPADIGLLPEEHRGGSSWVGSGDLSRCSNSGAVFPIPQ